MRNNIVIFYNQPTCLSAHKKARHLAFEPAIIHVLI